MAVTVWHPSAKKQQLEDAGSFTGGGHKFLVHTTEGPTLEGAFATVKAKRSAPHFILEVLHGRRRLVQCIPINRAARGLEHNSGPETNRANCIQVEVVGFTDRKAAAKLGHLELWVPNWSTDIYKHLHLLMQWAHDHFSVPMRADHPFVGQPGFARLSGQAFVNAVGLVGHCHAAGNDHVDPGPLNAHFVIFGPSASFGPTRTAHGAGTVASPETLTPRSTILGTPRATRAQLRRHLVARHDANPRQSRIKHSTLADIVQLYFKTCKSIGLDPLVAVSQMELETGHLTSKASQPPRRNPAGIGITGSGVQGVSFPNWNKAVRAHVGRLAAYAIPTGKGTPAQKALIVEALAVRPLGANKRGVAVRVAGLSRHWAEDKNYAKKVARIGKEIQVS
jgi:hypothetical protein